MSGMHDLGKRCRREQNARWKGENNEYEPIGEAGIFLGGYRIRKNYDKPGLAERNVGQVAGR
jgi:hypothetical protein